MHSRISLFLTLRLTAVLALAGIIPPLTGRADTTVYDNVGTINGFQYNGGAASDTGTTTLLADDITFQAGSAGLKVTSFTLAVANGSTTETATLTAVFYAADGTGGGPGTLLGSATKTATFANGQTFSTFSAASLFTIPANGKIWAGFYFTGVSVGGQTALNSLGSYFKAGPSVGTSTTSIFVGSGTATTGANPAGSFSVNPGGQGGNFGVSFAVPEPSSVLLSLAGGAGLVGIIARRRRNRS